MSELYPPMTPPYGFKLKREHFTYHEMNGSPWAQCAKHDDVYQECLDSGGFAIGDDCVGCVVEDRIVRLLESKLSQEMSESAGYIMTENNYPVRWADLMALIKKENK